jgi:large subunit ribosomal protein L1
MGSKKNVDMSATEDKIKVVESAEDANTPVVEGETAVEAKKVSAPRRIRSKKYVSSRSKVDKTKNYSLSEAITTIKKLSYSKFDGTITFDGVVGEPGKLGSVSLPHSTGKSIKVAIVDDDLLAELKAGNIDFDALVTTPQFMPKIAKFARVLGPRGLMPNPKNGTVTPKPELKKAELEKGKFDLKTEKKNPVIHVVIGKVSMDEKSLTENIEALYAATKGKLVSASISATMSPSVKLEVEK